MLWKCLRLHNFDNTQLSGERNHAFIDQLTSRRCFVELRWKESGLLWSQSQKDSEKVEDFVTRIRKSARRLDLDPKTLCDAVINGLRPKIRMFVLQQKVDSLEELIKIAKIAEEIAPTSDPLSTLLVESMKNTAQANEKQAAELKILSDKVAALGRVDETFNVLQSSHQNRVSTRRNLTPQNQQRKFYAQNFGNRVLPSSFQEPSQPRTNFSPRSATPCTRCGYEHAFGNCRAANQRCNFCGVRGHFAKCCLAARKPQSN